MSKPIIPKCTPGEPSSDGRNMIQRVGAGEVRIGYSGTEAREEHREGGPVKNCIPPLARGHKLRHSIGVSFVGAPKTIYRRRWGRLGPLVFHR